ncbi:MAG TPA: hypothetical protein VMG74_02405 [Gaiellaceae bacterium]|nr:hypothetical protein [Gaiellaceae bacterium]HUJ54945.1 hypothetical protein [Gaiellaceae bacterium]
MRRRFFLTVLLAAVALALPAGGSAAGPAASIAATSGSGQVATVNSEYGQPLQARVTDSGGNPVQGATVSFDVVPGTTGAAASFLGGQAIATTDANGLATSPLLVANGTPGTFTAVASVDGVSTTADYSLDNRAAVTTIAPVTTAALSATVATSYRDRLRARVLDASGHPLEGAAVSFAIAAGSAGATAGFLGGGVQATELTDSNGIATSPELQAGTTAGSFSATASVDGATDPATFILRAAAGKPATIAAGAASGESTPTGMRFRVPLAVTVTDRYGNPVAKALVVFAAPRRGPSGFFRKRHHATRVVRVKTNANGIAVAPRFDASRDAGGYLVRATVKGSRAHASFALVNNPR